MRCSTMPPWTAGVHPSSGENIAGSIDIRTRTNARWAFLEGEAFGGEAFGVVVGTVSADLWVGLLRPLLLMHHPHKDPVQFGPLMHHVVTAEVDLLDLITGEPEIREHDTRIILVM